MPPSYRIRPAGQADGAFLADMVVEAVNWRQGGGSIPKHQVMTSAEHSRYLSGWMRPGDAGLVALEGQDEPIGAAWYRMLPRSDPGFGYVGTGVPELIIGVRPIWRAHGVGRALLHALCDQARSEGFARISLSVERDNFAATLYRSEGFAVTQGARQRAGGLGRSPIGHSIGRDTMVKRLR